MQKYIIIYMPIKLEHISMRLEFDNTLADKVSTSMNKNIKN